MECNLPEHSKMPKHHHVLTDAATAMWLNHILEGDGEPANRGDEAGSESPPTD